MISEDTLELMQGDALEVLRTFGSETIQCCVTSPPYFGLRDYGVEGQLGVETTPETYIARMVEIFREVRRVLTNDGTLWLNLGDSYAAGGNGGGGSFKAERRGWGEFRVDKTGFRGPPPGLKKKDLIGIPWMAAFALRADGWYLRSDIIWEKKNPLPESVLDRPTRAHEYVFLLSKSETYFFDVEAIKEPAVKGAAGSKFNEGKTAQRQPGSSKKPRKNEILQKDRRKYGFQDRWDSKEPGELRRKRDVWSIGTEPYAGSHFAVMPTRLVEPCILAGSRQGDIVLDPFCGSGTVGVVALRHGRSFVGIDLNPEYLKQASERIYSSQPKEGAA